MTAWPMPLLALDSDTRRRLVVAGGLSSPAGLLRAQVNSTATAVGTDGVTFAGFGADQPRFVGAARRLLIEGQRTNALRNPRFEGAASGVLGAGGSPPTQMFFAAPGGIPWEILGTGSDRGIGYIRLRLAGTATSGAGVRLALDTTIGIPAAAGQVWSNAHFVRLVSGSQGGLSWSQEVREFSSGSAGSLTTGATVSWTADWQRVVTSRTLTDAGTTHQQPTIRIALANGAAYNFVIDVGWPQSELGAFASTPILPPVGSPQASARGADLVTAPLASLGVSADAAATILWSGTLSQVAASGADQMLLQLDDGTDANRFQLRCRPGAAGIVAGRVAAGVALDTATLGTVAAGATFRAGIALDGAGRMAASLNGAAAAVVTGGPVSGLLTLRLGNAAAGSAPMFGETAALQVLPRTLGDSALAAAVAALEA